MGAWGHGIRQDDVVLDVIGVFEDALKRGRGVPDATAAVKSRFAEALKDDDDAPLVRIALAEAQWTSGALDPEVLKQVQDDFASGRGLSLWEADPRGLARRRAALEKFITKIQSANLRPKKARTVVRAPKFQPGDCLSIRLANDHHAAALVLAADHSNVEYGMNLIGVLDYLSPDPPALDVFRGRAWLIRSHHNWNNAPDLAWYLPVRFRAVQRRIEVVGHIEILASDPKQSDAYTGWANIGEQARLQREWNAQSGQRAPEQR
jgi:hypothetical protein